MQNGFSEGDLNRILSHLRAVIRNVVELSFIFSLLLTGNKDGK